MDIGDVVTCINSTFHDYTLQITTQLPKKGNEYVIRDIIDYEGRIGVLLEEITNPPVKIINNYFEPSFLISRFRKLETPELKEIEEELENVGVS